MCRPLIIKAIAELYLNYKNMDINNPYYVDRVRQAGEHCPKCFKGKLESKKGKYGAFLGCTNWPGCDFTESVGINLQKLANDLLHANGKRKKRRRSKVNALKVTK